MKENSAEKVLNDQTSIPEMLNDSSIDRVMAIDLQWNIIAWNRTSEIISGIRKEEVLGKSLLDSFPEIGKDEEMMNAIYAAFSGKKTFLPSNQSGFNRMYSENHFIPLKNRSGEVIGVMNIMHDVAHRIKVEKQLQKLNQQLQKRYQQLQKANNDLATFTYITSRDIKEPLKHVYTSLELLVKKEGVSLSNISKGNLRRMQGSLNKMNLLLDDILTVSGFTSNKEPAETVSLDEMLALALNKLKGKIEESNAIIEAAPLPAIGGYKKMLEYFFLNLIDNGIKFQPEGNTPHIKIDCEKVNGESTGIKELIGDQTYLNIRFSDNGIGVDPVDNERIFHLFERIHDRKYHGSGIGLTICKKISEAHDGAIRPESQPGQGATFHCYFPVEIDE